MGPETVVTLVAVGLIVAAIAVYLIGITYNLRKASLNLRGVTKGVGVIHGRTQPVGGVLGEIAGETRAIAEALTALVAKATGATPQVPLPMHDAVESALAGNGHVRVAESPPPASMHEAVSRARTNAPADPPPPAAADDDIDDGWEEDPVDEPKEDVDDGFRDPRPLIATPVGVHWSPPVRSQRAPRPRPSAQGPSAGTRPRSTGADDAAPVRRRRRRSAGAAESQAPETVDMAGSQAQRGSMSEAVARAREAVAGGAR